MDNKKSLKSFKKFLNSQHLMSVSVCINNESWSFNCFYVYDEKNNRLIFTSKANTKHIEIINKNNKVSGTISNNEKRILMIKGIQFTWSIFKVEDATYYNNVKNILLFKSFDFVRNTLHLETATTSRKNYRHDDFEFLLRRLSHNSKTTPN